MDPYEFEDDDEDDKALLTEYHPKRPQTQRQTVSSALCSRDSLIFISVLLILLSAVIGVIILSWPVAKHSATGHYKHAAVASDAPQCSLIGKSILYDKNGSAVDAAVASLVCLGVHNAQSCGIGGGFFMVVYDVPRGGDKKVLTAFNAREVAPLAATVDMFSDGTSSRVGGKSIAVPGEIQGYYEAWKVYGRLPWKDLIMPTAELCRDGFIVDYSLAQTIKQREAVIRNTSSLRDVFVKKDGSLYKEGDTMRRPRLGKTLERIANIRNISDLQSGVFSDMVDDIKEHGGIITAEDFAQYKVKITTPLSVQLSHTHNYTIYSLGPPGSGIVYAFMLRLLEGYNLTFRDISDEKKSVETYHKIIESFKFSYALRTYMGDEDFVNNTKIMELLSSQSFADEIRARINLTHTQNISYYGPESQLLSDAGTSHLSVLASNGGAVAATSTINQWFGSQRIGRKTGILFNDEMDDFSMPVASNASGVGLAPSKENQISPRKRPMSSMCPSIILDENGNVVLIIGASGGPQITTAVAWVTAHTLWLGKTIDKAIDMNRIHDQLDPDGFIAEKNIPRGLINGLRAKGHKLRPDELSNVVQAIHSTCHHMPQNCSFSTNKVSRCSEPCITAVSDRRKGGKPEGY